MRCLSGIGIERYKLLIMNGGIVILVLGIILLCREDFSGKVYASMTDMYMQEFSGDITDETLLIIEDRIESLKQGIEMYDDAVTKVQADEITNAEYLIIANEHAGDRSKLLAIEEVKKIIVKLQECESKLECQIQIVDDLPFREIYGNEAEDIRMQRWIITLLTISLVFASYMTIENTSEGLRQVIRYNPRGRGRFLAWKYRVAMEVIIVILLITTLLEVSEFIKLDGKELISIPVQSIRVLIGVPLKITLGQFLLIIYIARSLIIASITSIILFLSSLFHRVEVAYLLISVIMILPSALWKYMNLEVLQWFSPLKAIDIIGQITMIEGKFESALWSCVIVGIMGVGSAILMQRKWCK